MPAEKALIHTPHSLLSDIAMQGLLERMEWLLTKPKNLLVISDCYENWEAEWRSRYPEARIEMQSTHDAKNWLQHQANTQFDWIITNLALPQEKNSTDFIQLTKSSLHENGLWISSFLGPDSLSNIQPHRMIHFNTHDMHDIGDALLQSGLIEPVLDVDYQTLAYRSIKEGIADLTDMNYLTGSIESHEIAWEPTEDHRWHATFELVYAHAFMPQASAQGTSRDGTVNISLAALRRQLQAR